MSLSVKVGGTWTEVADVQTRKGGGWVPVQKVWAKESNAWKLVWQGQVTETFEFSEGQTYYDSGVKDASGFRGRIKNTSEEQRANRSLYVGHSPADQPSYPDYNRGLWIPGNGSVSGTGIHDALNGREIISFLIDLELSWSDYDLYEPPVGDDNPSYMYLWGTTETSIPTDFNPAYMKYLATIAWYGSAADVSAGYAVIGESELGTNPPVSDDRDPVFYAGIDLTSQLSASAKTNLTNGTIKSFVFQPYDKNGTAQSQYQHAQLHSLEPGRSVDGFPGTGNANNFRITVTHQAA